MVLGGRYDVLAQSVDELGPLEQPAQLVRVAPVADVRVVEDVRERPATVVLAQDVRGNAFRFRRARREERERVAEKVAKRHGRDCMLAVVKRRLATARFAERVVHGVDDQGSEERIVIWIERRPGALWAVGRAVNPHLRSSDDPRRDDYVFEGYELDDALEHANGTLRDDARVSEQDRRPASVSLFAREEILQPLERWFFGR